MRRIGVFIICASVCILLTRCNSFYATTQPSVPVFDGRNDLVASANIGAAGINTNVAWSPLNHFYFGGAFHAYKRYYEFNFTGGPYCGFYINSSDNSFHLNLQIGYHYGSSDFGGQGVSGKSWYNVLQSQIFLAQLAGKKKHVRIGLGGLLDYAEMNYHKMHYDYSGPDRLSNQLYLYGIFLHTQRTYDWLPGFKTTWQFGYQVADADEGDPDDFTLFQPLIFRFGVSYQFHPSFRKRK